MRLFIFRVEKVVELTKIDNYPLVITGQEINHTIATIIPDTSLNP